jgi:hypothetical protein
VLAALYGCAAPSPDSAGLDSTAIDYNWHVRPILSEHCFKCHGPDPAARKAGLRLDVRELAVGELPETPGKHAIVPSNAGASELVRRIRATNVDERMPPESTHKTLTAQQIAILEQWIENGAEYRPHWAFIAPQRPAVPSVADTAAARNEIDHFVRARLAHDVACPQDGLLAARLLRLPAGEHIGQEVRRLYVHAPPANILHRNGLRPALVIEERAFFVGSPRDHDRRLEPLRGGVIARLNAARHLPVHDRVAVPRAID